MLAIFNRFAFCGCFISDGTILILELLIYELREEEYDRFEDMTLQYFLFSTLYI